MISIIWGIAFIVPLAFLFGIGLAVLAKVFEVKEDPRIGLIQNALPGVNCGACGFPGCSGYADAILKRGVDINLCTPGGEKSAKKIGDILGIKPLTKIKMVAKVMCLGDDRIAMKDYIFDGEDDCSVVYNLFNGEKKCKYGCVGNGNCARVCPTGAVKRDELNRVWIDSNLCIGCERCLTVCPPKVIKMVPENGGHFVACSSYYNGKIVKQICKKGCIGCKICERVSDPGRIVVNNNLAVVNYSLKASLQQAAMKCPADVILPIIDQKAFIKKGSADHAPPVVMPTSVAPENINISIKENKNNNNDFSETISAKIKRNSEAHDQNSSRNED